MVGVILLLTVVGLQVRPPSPFPAQEKVNPPPRSLEHQLGQSGVFQPLRTVRLLDLRFVMLKHQPTSQRLGLLEIPPQHVDTYTRLYTHPLSPWEVGMILRLLQKNTRFEGRAIAVRRVTRVSARQTLSGAVGCLATCDMPYYRYDVQTTVDATPVTFEVLVGKLTRQGTDQALLFTFNEKGYADSRLFEDVLRWSDSPIPHDRERQNAAV